MSEKFLPKHFIMLEEKYGSFMDAVNKLGEVVRHQGPIDAKHGQLIQLAAAVALRSEGAVHSHTRRALEMGATQEEIRHTIILLTSTLGFPIVSAALSWVQDIMN